MVWFILRIRPKIQISLSALATEEIEEDFETKMALKFVATGTGRCATKSVARMFHFAGLVSGHEEAFQWGGGMPDFDGEFSHLEVDTSYLAAPFVGRLPDSVKIIHLIRHPIRAIESIYDGQWWDGPETMASYSLFVHNTLPSLHDYEGWDKYVHYVLEWNRMIEPYADYRFRIEMDDPRALLDWCGIIPKEFHWKRYNDSGVEHPKLQPHLIKPTLMCELIDMCDRYGYVY